MRKERWKVRGVTREKHSRREIRLKWEILDLYTLEELFLKLTLLFFILALDFIVLPDYVQSLPD